jgi:DNA-binding CsgD family transcriptional regulator
MFDLIPKEKKGEVCELYVMGLSMKQIGRELGLSYALVSKIINSYLGIGEQPILLTFTAE